MRFFTRSTKSCFAFNEVSLSSFIPWLIKMIDFDVYNDLADEIRDGSSCQGMHEFPMLDVQLEPAKVELQ